MVDARDYDCMFAAAREIARVTATLARELRRVDTIPALEAVRAATVQTGHLQSQLAAASAHLAAVQSVAVMSKGQIAQIADATRQLQSALSMMSLPGAGAALDLSSQLGSARAADAARLGRPEVNAILRLSAASGLAASVAAQQKLLAMRTLPKGGLVLSDSTFRRSTAAHMTQLTRSYEGLMVAASEDSTLVDFLPAVTSFAPVDVYRHVEAVQSLTVPPEAEQYSSEAIYESLDQGAPTVEDLLDCIDPALRRLLFGARSSLVSGNPDRPRHVTTSLRELITQVLHGLAPDASMAAWTDLPDHFHNGRPTRRARILYICRSVNSGPFAVFVGADVSSAIALVEALNAGTHAVTSALTDEQLEAMIARMEALILFLARIGHACEPI